MTAHQGRKISGNGPETPCLTVHQRNANHEFDAASSAAGQAEGATQQFRPLSHAGEPGSSPWRGPVCAEANAIVADLQDELAMLASQPHIHLLGLRMFADLDELLLDDTQDTDLRRRRDGKIGLH